MQIQINSDNHTEATSSLIEELETLLQDRLRRFSPRITRLEVHLTDQNSAAKGGDDDMRCKIEARLSGMQPVAVSNEAATVVESVRGAATKLRSLLDSTLGKLNDRV